MDNKILNKCIFGAILLLLTACMQDEEPDGNTLPEGKYPLEIASVTMDVTHSQQPWSVDAPQPRVIENPDGNSGTWEWDGTERIGVQLYADVATYTLNTDKILTADKTLYWKDTKNTTVTAWYPVETEVSLANQKDKLAYVLKGSGTGNYNTPVRLGFTHVLAKVRVVFSGESTADLTNALVSILAPTTCTVNKGVVTPGSTTDYIPMHEATYSDGKVCYEANVTPNLTLKDNAFRLVVGSKTVDCSTTEVLTQAGQLHVVTLTVNEKVTEVNVSDISGTEYTISGNVHLKGDGQPKDLKLVVEAGGELTLEDVVLTPTADGNAVTCKGDATITLKGSNTLTSGYASGSDGYCGIQVEGGTLTINGDDNAKLVATGAAGIGASNGANITINGGHIIADASGKDGESGGIGSRKGQGCGTVMINGGIIEARGGSFSAGIGNSNGGTCGNIIITGGNIKAYGGQWGSGIGSNIINTYNVDIIISGENTVVHAEAGAPHPYLGSAAAIGGGSSSVTVKAGATVNGKKYTQDETGEVN